MSPRPLEEMDFSTVAKKQTCIMGLEETDWGKMSVLTVGSFHEFIKNVILICVLQVKVHIFQKIMIFMFSV